jgi:hypothetical protein
MMALTCLHESLSFACVRNGNELLIAIASNQIQYHSVQVDLEC